MRVCVRVYIASNKKHKKEIYDISLDILIEKKSATAKNDGGEGLGLFSLMRYIGNDAMKQGCADVDVAVQSYRDSGHSMTCDSMLDYACRTESKQEEIVDGLSEEKFRLTVTLQFGFETVRTFTSVSE